MPFFQVLPFIGKTMTARESPKNDFKRLAILNYHNTVKLGYNEHGYNEFTAITNKIY